MTELVLHRIQFNSLPDKVKEKVVRTFKNWLHEVYKILVFKSQIGQMFYEMNTVIEFYLDEEGVKRFRVDDSDERLARFLGDQFAITAKHDKDVYNKILINMIKRNDGTDRLKVK